MAGALARFAAVISEEVAENYLANDTSAFGGRFDPRSYGGPAVLDEDLGGRGTLDVLRETFGFTTTPPEDLPPIGPNARECFLLRWISDRPADFPSSGFTVGGLPEWTPFRPTPFGASAMIWRLNADGRTAPCGTYSDGVWVRAGASSPESPAAGTRAGIPANGRFAGFEGAEHRAFLDVETELMVWLFPAAGGLDSGSGSGPGPGQRVSPQKLDHWYDVWTRFVWRDRVFLALRFGDDQVEGQLCERSLSWARANGLEVCSRDHVYGRFPLAEVSGLREVRTDLSAEWGARNLSPTPGPGSGTDFGRRLRDALAPESGEPDVDAMVSVWPGGSGPRIVLDYLLEALVVTAFSGPDDRGVLAFSRELGTALAASHPIEPIHVAMTVSRALGDTETMPPPELSPVERLRITLAICAKVGGFRGREHVDWLIRQGEGAAARAGHGVS
jgi:hypothetical protein